MAERLASCPDHLHVQLPVNPTDVVIQRLEAETDEMWGFVEKKVNKTKLLRSRPVRRITSNISTTP
jgi:hypothetical protein